ncbi:MAG: hypothetical protein PF445_10450 [Melioribacteraceae bacterium]|nr:hypothetical protein [Melioribacteraceae bacterium]
MKTIQMRKKSFAIIIFTIAMMLLNSLQIIGSGKVLYEKKYTVESSELLLVKMTAADVEVKSWDKDEVYIVVKGDEGINKYLDFEFSYENNVVEIIAEKNLIGVVGITGVGQMIL